MSQQNKTEIQNPNTKAQANDQAQLDDALLNAITGGAAAAPDSADCSSEAAENAPHGDARSPFGGSTKPVM